ncbi:hypothetical protein PTNB73_06444 [Pyrenophora teres f. teres]|nr:hypothetical protein HRS9139_07207 [Pyrenophora teres f. teres]KAE8863237.1 hypothetical protein PTNB73_06444 [Pyrenophora teres f. teres]
MVLVKLGSDSPEALLTPPFAHYGCNVLHWRIRDSEAESPTFWEADCILAEKVVGGKRKYHIKWKGSDPVTGKPWPTSWEPEGNANRLLIADWNQKKALRANDSTVEQSKTRGLSEQQHQAQPSRRIRNSRVVDSSPECDRSSSSTAPSTTVQSRGSSASVATSSTHISPHIRIAPRGESLGRDEYGLFSQLASTPEKSQDTDLDSSQLFAARPPSRPRSRSRLYSPSIVLDSQSSTGEASFVPITQRSDFTNQQSTNTNESHLEETTEDSGLLDILQEAASRAVSPAVSIPETIPDTTAESSQTQLQELDDVTHVSGQHHDDVDEEEVEQVADSQRQDNELEYTELEPPTTASQPASEHAPQSTAQCDQQQQTLISHEQNSTQVEANTSTGFVDIAEITISTNTATTVLGGRNAQRPQESDTISDSVQIGRGRVDDASQPLVSQQAGVREDSQGRLTESSVSEPSQHLIREQNAQFVPLEPLEAELSFQEDTTQSIRPTIEKDYCAHRASSESRHDSSQESPDQSCRSLDHSASPIPYPPSYSRRTQHSPPPRPFTPVPTSSPSIMAGESTADIVKRELDEALAKALAENPFTPRKRFNKASFMASMKAPESLATTPASSPTPSSKQIRANDATEGTRSPSAVPDHSPIAHIPTSLRNVAYAPSAEETAIAVSVAPPEPVEVEATVPAEPTVPPVPVSIASEDMEVSDADDEDNESLLNDEVELAEQEYIVPLYIQGRQRNMYAQSIADKKDVLDRFLKNHRDFNPVSQIEDFLSYLRAIETHIDLTFAEAGMSFQDAASATQVEHVHDWTLENATKFMFLHTLFHKLRDDEPQKHVVLVTEKDDDELFKILKTFCEAEYINFNMPTRDHRANRADIVGNLLVTIIPNDASPVLRPADLIVCLDGVQDATQIRRKNWAKSADRNVVPVVHLVIPRTVGHIERYILASLDQRNRLHTILATLAQLRPDIGSAIDDTTPQPAVCAELVASWIRDQTEGAEQSWPIPSIGGFKEVIQFQTQFSQPSTDSPVAPERIKRPLVDEELDPAKRMRFTPQPQPVSSSIDKEPEITHISDSMPGTVIDDPDLRIRLAQLEEAYKKEYESRKAEERRFREHEESWDRQQTIHENLAREYRLLVNKLHVTEAKLDTQTKQNATLTERLTSRTTEVRELKGQLAEQRATHLLSPENQIAEITNLRNRLAAALEEKDRAVKAASTADKMLQYTKEVYRDAQTAASTSTARITDLEAENARLSKMSSGEAAKLKDLHFGSSYALLEEKVKNLTAELTIVKRTLHTKEEEVLRLRTVGRPGVGTRGTSATPQPKIRSRAGSPSLTGGRVANLRNG